MQYIDSSATHINMSRKLKEYTRILMKTKIAPSYAGLVWRGQVSWSCCRLFLYRAFVLSEWSSRCCSDIHMILHNTQQYSTILNMIFFFERSCHVDWRANEYLEQTPTILRKCAMVCYGQESRVRLDGHQSTNRDLYTHRKDSQCGMDDHIL